MEVIINGEKKPLLKKERKVGSEAPACRVTMLDGETRVIGMMAPKVQVMVTLANSFDLNAALLGILTKYKERANIYIISASELDNEFDPAATSYDFKDFTLKYGVNIDDAKCAKSLFIIDKEGEILYKEVLATLMDEFELQKFESELEAAINFKKKGHVHENWMGV